MSLFLFLEICGLFSCIAGSSLFCFLGACCISSGLSSVNWLLCASCIFLKNECLSVSVEPIGIASVSFSPKWFMLFSSCWSVLMSCVRGYLYGSCSACIFAQSCQYYTLTIA